MSTRELFEYDSSLDFALIAGIDEAGRGPLAGPVVCASCIMPLDDMIDGINDSKKIGEKKREPFMKAFADVYAKFAVFSEENAGKICAAAEDLYLTLEECDALSYCDERAEIAAAIYREARLEGGERKFDEIVKMFEANKYVTETILNFMM